MPGHWRRYRRPSTSRGVSFQYSQADATPVLEKIDLTIHKGEVVALVGRSGAGKTTLASLLPRFYDVTSGQIAFDGNDIRDVTLQSLRKQIAIVTQETLLFNDTVRNNIALRKAGRHPGRNRGGRQGSLHT